MSCFKFRQRRMSKNVASALVLIRLKDNHVRRIVSCRYAFIYLYYIPITDCPITNVATFASAPVRKILKFTIIHKQNTGLVLILRNETSIN